MENSKASDKRNLGPVLNYVSVNSKPDYLPTRATPGDLQVLTVRGVGFSPSFLCPGGQGYELEKFSTVLKEKCKNFSICFKEP